MEEILKMEKSELHAKLAELRKEAAKSKLDITSGKTSSTHKVKALKKDIARVLTVLNTK